MGPLQGLEHALIFAKTTAAALIRSDSVRVLYYRDHTPENRAFFQGFLYGDRTHQNRASFEGCRGERGLHK